MIIRFFIKEHTIIFLHCWELVKIVSSEHISSIFSLFFPFTNSLFNGNCINYMRDSPVLLYNVLPVVLKIVPENVMPYVHHVIVFSQALLCMHLSSGHPNGEGPKLIDYILNC